MTGIIEDLINFFEDLSNNKVRFKRKFEWTQDEDDIKFLLANQGEYNSKVASLNYNSKSEDVRFSYSLRQGRDHFTRKSWEITYKQNGTLIINFEEFRLAYSQGHDDTDSSTVIIQAREIANSGITQKRGDWRSKVYSSSPLNSLHIKDEEDLCTRALEIVQHYTSPLYQMAVHRKLYFFFEGSGMMSKPENKVVSQIISSYLP